MTQTFFCLLFFFFRSPTFHNFVKVALTKNPKKRPTAEKLLLVSGIKICELVRVNCIPHSCCIGCTFIEELYSELRCVHYMAQKI